MRPSLWALLVCAGCGANGSHGAQITFGAPIVAPDSNLGAMTTGDFNGDGKLDVVALLNDTGQLRLYLGDGAGELANHTTYSAAPGISDCASGDLNGDGALDLVTASGFATGGGASLNAYPGTGSGTFLSSQAVPAHGPPIRVVLADLDGDGQDDPISANTDQTLSLFLSTLTQRGDQLLAAVPSALAAADLDGDGKLDLVVGDQAGAVEVFLGEALAARPPLPIASGPVVELRVVDLDHDGRLDLVAAMAGGVVTALGAGDGSFAVQPAVVADRDVTGMVVADFDRDGEWDVALLDDGGSGLAVRAGRGGGKLGAPRSLDGVFPGGTLTTGDFNGDGKPDLLIGGQILLDQSK